MQVREGEAQPGAFRAPEVWLIDLRACAEALQRIEAQWRLLPNDFAAEGERRLAHVALRVLLMRAGERDAGVPFSSSRYGKPKLEGGGEFSLSHTEGFALVGLGGNDAIGVDLERRDRVLRMRPVRAELVRGAGRSAAACGRSVESYPGDALASDDAGTLQAWVRLEAVSKADGIGIGRLLGELGVLGSRRAAEDVSRAERLAKYFVQDLHLESSLVAAVATAHPDVALRTFCMPAIMEKIAAFAGDHDRLRRIGD